MAYECVLASAPGMPNHPCLPAGSACATVCPSRLRKPGSVQTPGSPALLSHISYTPPLASCCLFQPLAQAATSAAGLALGASLAVTALTIQAGAALTKRILVLFVEGATKTVDAVIFAEHATLTVG